MPKYLIIEKDYNTVYAYIENETQFKRASRFRVQAFRRPEKDLDSECDLDAYCEGTHFVFELKEKTSAKRKAVKTRKSKVVKKRAARKASRKQAR